MQKMLRRGDKNTLKNCTKKIFTTQIIMMVIISIIISVTSDMQMTPNLWHKVKN